MLKIIIADILADKEKHFFCLQQKNCRTYISSSKNMSKNIYFGMRRTIFSF